MRNRRKTTSKTSSRYVGVTKLKRKQKWRARILVDGRRIYLGDFNSESAAAHAYDTAARKYHKEFAALNFKDYT